MASLHRKLMSAAYVPSTEDYCYGTCTADCISSTPSCMTYCCNSSSYSSPWLPLYPPPPPPNSSDHPFKNSNLLIIITFSLVTTIFIALWCYIIHRKYNSRRSAQQQTLVEQRIRDDFVDEDRGPIIDHPIWYIRTVGLDHAVIDSIAVIRYEKGEGLIEGTDCSVCLSEFEEDETLRLLPKCSHAFHIPCIDTWLRSRTNCPLCRVPIVSNTAVVSLCPEETNVEESIPAGEIRMDVSEESGEAEGEGEDPSDLRPNSNRDFTEGETSVGDTEQGIQPIRRSVSLDSLAASKIIREFWNSDDRSVKAKESKVVIVPRRVGGSRRFLKLMMGSSSIGRSLQSGPVLMKRSSSCHGKLGRNPDLPVRSF